MNMKSQDSRKCAVALVLVLGFLVIISALAVAFFASVTTELRASRNFQSNVNTRQLQDSVVNIVEGQIRQATSVVASNNLTQNVSWASQPGMISTYGAGGQASSNLLTCYKLYSSNVMTVPGSGSSSLPPTSLIGDYSTTYDQNPAIWTDINSPVFVQDPNSPNNPQQSLPRFPVIDPRALYNTGGVIPAGSATATNGVGFCPLVEGFNYTASAAAGAFQPYQVNVDAAQTASGSNDATSYGNDARLAMPVRWMYVLKDGTLTAPNNPTGASIQATWSQSATSPSSTNPIVGRVAFWTDDDTCKVNVNTAGGAVWTSSATANNYSSDQWAGAYWDTPRMTSQFDEGQVYGPGVLNYTSGTSGNGGQPVQGLGGLATTQMLQNEFQRYPGHPAQTSLALIFNNLMTAEQLYMLTPRIAYNGFNNGSTGGTANTSVEGTNRLHLNPSTPIAGAATSGATANLPLPIRYDRLYDSVDELIFAFNSQNGESGPRRTNINFLNLGATSSYTTSNINSQTQFTPGLLDRLRFFLTAYNRAPELNLFGHPRICVWPIRSQGWTDDTNPLTSGINAYDSLSLFCSTIGPAVYSYPGLNSDAPSSTFGATVTGSITSPPFRYSFFRHEPINASMTSQTLDISLPRNQDLLKYLQQLVQQNIPGFGGSFQAKYGVANMNETLVEMFDYIRCANLYDTTVVNSIANPSNLNPSPASNPHPFSPTGIVMPSVGALSAGTQLGMGRFPTICEASILFYYCGSNLTNPQSTITTSTSSPVTTAGCYALPSGVNTSGSPGNPAVGTTQEYLENSGQLVIIPPTMAYAGGSATPSKPLQIPSQRYMRAAMIFSTFNPMQGYGPIQNPAPNFPLSGNQNPLVQFVVTGLNSFSINSGNVTVSGQPFPVDGGTISLGATSGYFWAGRNFGGFEGFAHTLFNASTFQTQTPVQGNYPLITPATAPMKLSVGNLNYPAGPGGIAPVSPAQPNKIADYEEAAIPNFTLLGGTVNVSVQFGGAVIQKLSITFPKTQVLPAPRGDDIIDAEPFMVTVDSTKTPPALNPAPLVLGKPVLANGNQNGVTPATTIPALDSEATPVSAGGFSFSAGGPQPYGQLRRWYWSQDRGSFDPNQGRAIPGHPNGVAATWANTGATWGRTLGAARDFQLRINWALNGPGGQQSNSDDPVAISSSPGTISGWAGNRWRQLVQPGDTVRSMIFTDFPTTSTTSGTTTTGDLRLAAVTNAVVSPTNGVLTASSTLPGFYPHPDYGSTSLMQACLLRTASAALYFNYASDNFFNLAAGGTTGLTGTGPLGYGQQPQGAQASVANQNGNTLGTAVYSNQNPFGNHLQLGGTGSANGLTGKYFQPAACVGDIPRKLTSGSPTLPVMVNGVVRQDGKAGDFDTGVGAYPDGPYFNKQDEGNAIFVYEDTYTGVVYYPIPYFGDGSYAAPGSAFNSPNRQMPSPVMMGSLLSQASPGGGNTQHGWETLCFCPNPAGVGHNGNASPKDHLLLDLFQMPVVQPYPISEPFSTAGKVNLNYQIQPFDYITRTTALRATIATERVTLMGAATSVGISPSAISNPPPLASSTSSPLYWCYKQQSTGANGMTNLISTDPRKLIDRDQTVNEIGYYIAANGLFRSPSQICEIYLVPLGWTNIATNVPTTSTSTSAFTTAATAAQALWTTTGDLTGDNLREKPYADIYPRLTTKSNTYTIHMRVQALRQQPHPPGSSAYLTWDESKDSVLGEYRGSATIERYIDPADRHFNPADSLTQSTGDFVNPDNTLPGNSLESLYRFRTTNTKKFSP